MRTADGGQGGLDRSLTARFGEPLRVDASANAPAAAAAAGAFGAARAGRSGESAFESGSRSRRTAIAREQAFARGSLGYLATRADLVISALIAEMVGVGVILIVPYASQFGVPDIRGLVLEGVALTVLGMIVLAGDFTQKAARAYHSYEEFANRRAHAAWFLRIVAWAIGEAALRVVVAAALGGVLGWLLLRAAQ